MKPKQTTPIVDALRESMEDAAATETLRRLESVIVKFAYHIAKEGGVDNHEIIAYALSRAALTLTNELGMKQPMVAALCELWPDVFREYSREEIEELLDRKIKAETELPKYRARSRVARQIFSRPARTGTGRPASA